VPGGASDREVDLKAWRELTGVAGWIAVCVLVGLLVGVTAVGFSLGVERLSVLWREPLPLQIPDAGPVWRLSVGLALLVAALVVGELLSRLADGVVQGPAYLIDAARRDVDPSLRAGFVSTLVAFSSLSGGASVGVFGPLVHLGGCLATLIRRIWQSLVGTHWAVLPRAVLHGAGAAAAISAVFSAPLGGVIFGHESVTGRFDRSTTGAMLASAFASYWISHQVLGVKPLFATTVVPSLSAVNLLVAACLGVAAGLLSTLYIVWTRGMPAWAAASGIPRRWQPLVPALMLFAVSPWLPHLLGSGTGAIGLAMAGKLAPTLLLVLLLAKLVATPVCLGFGLSGGVFGPALFLGAMLGALVEVILPGEGASTFAVLGAASCVASAVGAPISAVVIVFELTGSYPWAVLSMISVLASSQIARVLAGGSLFDRGAWPSPQQP
jgi:CIC family chloride channel protein